MVVLGLAVAFIATDIILLAFGLLNPQNNYVLQTIPAIQSVAMLLLVTVTVLNILGLREAEETPHVHAHMIDHRISVQDHTAEYLSLNITNDGPGVAREVEISNIAVENVPDDVALDVRDYLSTIPFIKYKATYLAKPNYLEAPVIEVHNQPEGIVGFNLRNGRPLDIEQTRNMIIRFKITCLDNSDHVFTERVALRMGTYLHT